jgi:cell division protein FtsN
MARDYKYRANHSKKKPQPTKVAWWKWVLIVFLICLFISFLVFLANSAPDNSQKKQPTKLTSIPKKHKSAKKIPKHQDKKPEEPQFVFYSVLTEEETVVADHEINTRSREEKFGKIKASKYLIQAGSFREASEADKLKAQLTLLNFHPRVEKAKVKHTVWNRVRLGPYSHPSKVASIKKQLKKSGIDVIVTEIKR